MWPPLLDEFSLLLVLTCAALAIHRCAARISAARGVPPPERAEREFVRVPFYEFGHADLLPDIFAHLSAFDLCRSSEVSRGWCVVSRSDSIWRRLSRRPRVAECLTPTGLPCAHNGYDPLMTAASHMVGGGADSQLAVRACVCARSLRPVGVHGRRRKGRARLRGRQLLPTADGLRFPTPRRYRAYAFLHELALVRHDNLRWCRRSIASLAWHASRGHVQRVCAMLWALPLRDCEKTNYGT